ncbi:MAG: hypothetical protein C4336_03935 [Armatimonadota bacterium]
MRDSTRYAWWLLTLLFSLLISLNFALLARELLANERAEQNTPAEVDRTLKVVLAFGTRPTENPLLNPTLTELDQPSFEALLRKAVLEAYAGLDRYAETLQKAETMPAGDLTPAQRRWYASLWRWALRSTLRAESVPILIDALRPTVPPPYLRLAEAVFYQQLGQAQKAESIRQQLRLQGLISMTIVLVVLGAIAIGGVGGLGILAWLALNPPRFAERPIANSSPFVLDATLWAMVLFLLTILISPAECLASFLKGLGIEAHSPLLLNQLFASAISLAFLYTVRDRLGQGIALNWFARQGFAKHLLWTTVGGVVYVPIAVAGLIFVILFAPTLSSQQNPIVESAQSAEGWLHWAMIFVQAVVLAPVVEEFLFRGVLFQVLWQRTGRVWLSAFVSGFLFAIIHPQFLAGLIPLTAIGTVLALLYAHTRSLTPSIVLHALNNLVSTLVLWVVSACCGS